jgi:hypothetical protein
MESVDRSSAAAEDCESVGSTTVPSDKVYGSDSMDVAWATAAAAAASSSSEKKRILAACESLGVVITIGLGSGGLVAV